MTIALAIPPLTVKNRGGGALIQDRALNRANTVYLSIPRQSWPLISVPKKFQVTLR